MKAFIKDFSSFEDHSEDLIRLSMLKPARCRSCIHLNFDYIYGRYVSNLGFFCGLHGMASVNPDGHQQNLDRHGSCGYSPKFRVTQLTFNF